MANFKTLAQEMDQVVACSKLQDRELHLLAYVVACFNKTILEVSQFNVAEMGAFLANLGILSGKALKIPNHHEILKPVYQKYRDWFEVEKILKDLEQPCPKI